MAIRQFDELNTISKSDKRKRFEEYFGEMELPEEEIEERISLAEELEAIFKKLFVMLMAALAAIDKTALDRQFYYDNMLFKYQEVLASAGYSDLSDRLSNYISRTTMSIVDTTIDYSDTPYYVSDERSVFLAMDETNAVMNYDREMKAREAGYTHKTWITKNDNRVRDTHVLMNGQTIEINNTFHVGIYEMRFPLDVMLGAGPEEVVRCRCVCKYTNKILQNADNGDNIHKEKDVLVHRSLGAKAVEYNVLDLKTFEEFTVVGDTKIQNVETFAGYGTNVKYNKAEFYARRYGGEPEKWQHTKGIAVLDFYGEYRKAEIHWSQCEGVGKFEFFVKEWLE